MRATISVCRLESEDYFYATEGHFDLCMRTFKLIYSHTYACVMCCTKMPEKKNCGNKADVAIYRDAKQLNMGGKIETCVKKIFLNRDQKIKCITDAVGLSAACAGCWADETQCIEAHCIRQCISPDAGKCTACVNQYCIPGVAECAGLPLWALNVSLIVK